MIVRVICANRLTLTHVVKRTLDIDEQVRRAAYKFIADKIHIKSMTIAQREEIISLTKHVGQTTVLRYLWHQEKQSVGGIFDIADYV